MAFVMGLFGGLLGCVAGALLFTAGWLLGSQPAGKPRKEEETTRPARVSAGQADAQWRELYNFLNYDGGEMPAGKAQAEAGPRR